MPLKVTGRREDGKGANTHYKLSNGNIITRAKGVTMRRRGELPGYHIVKVNGVDYLRDNPDNRKGDNIDSQPLV